MASFFVKVQKNGNWSLIEQSYDLGKSMQNAVSKSAFANLGFDFRWPVEKAKEHCRLLNQQEKFKRKEQHKIAAIGQRVEDLKVAQSIYLPEPLTDQFHKNLMQKSFGSDKHQARIHSHWKYIQKMVNELKIEVQDYFENKERIYDHFLTNELSPDYVSKLLRILNMFGLYICKQRQLPFETVPAPNSHIRNKIDEAYQDSEDYIGESDPLTPEALEAVKDRFYNPDNYKWLFISVWLGLRPVEIDELKKSKSWKIEFNPTHNLNVLWIYQSKLTRIKRDKRWKQIPIHFKEQQEALELVQKQEFKRPTRAMLHKLFPEPQFITTYAGRKGFVNLMLSKGQPLEAISSWMGHQDISITWKKYRDKEEVILGKKSS
jgi:integrase